MPPDIRHHLEDFRAFMASTYGVRPLGDFRADNQFHGMKTEEDRGGAKPFRYCVHLDGRQNVYFTDLKRGISGVWFPEGQEPPSAAEREQLRREAEAQRLARERQLADWQARAAAKARKDWGRATRASPEHPYLVRKGVGVHGLRSLSVWETWHEPEGGRPVPLCVLDVLLVPMRDQAGELHNVQAIFPEVCPELGRDKDFPPRARKKGLMHWIGARTDTVCLAEGYATAATIHEATGYRVFVCFDAGNLPIVAETVRAMLPTARIVVCADHDAPDRRGRQAGIEKAHEAAALAGGFVALPPVEGADFNDWGALLRGGAHGG
jgi:putative DNA primase/helicase